MRTKDQRGVTINLTNIFTDIGTKAAYRFISWGEGAPWEDGRKSQVFGMQFANCPITPEFEFP